MLESNFTRLTKIETKIKTKIVFLFLFLFQVFVSFLVFSKSKLCKNNKKNKKIFKNLL